MSSPGSFAWFDRESSSWRTAQLSLAGGWDEFSLTWPRAGMTRNGTAFLRQPLVPLISVIGSTSWLTPSANDCKPSGPKETEQMMLYEAGQNVPDTYKRLRSQVAARERVPTPTVNDAKNSTCPPSQRGRASLVGHIMRTGLVSTPTATRRGSYKEGRTIKKGGCRNLSEDVAALGTRGELNPEWVEWLMGFPIGWTDCEQSATP